MSEFGSAYSGGAPHSRGRYTPTSESAARSIEPVLSDLQKRILARLLCAGAEGMTADEVAEALDLYRYTAAPRLRELVLLGWADDAGRTRPTPRGKASIVFVARTERRAPALRTPLKRREKLEQRLAALEEEVAELRRTIGGAQRRLL